MRRWLYLLFLLSAPALALNCQSPAGAVADFSLAAKASGKTSAELLSCALGSEKAIFITATVDSSLVRSRAFVRYAFFDGTGRPLNTGSTPPAIGQFRALRLRHQVQVPDGARRLTLVAHVESKASDATGVVNLRGLQLKPALAAVLDLNNEGVINSRQPLLVGLVLRGGMAGVKADISLVDIDGKTVRKLEAQPLTGAETRLTLDPLPVGFYQVEVKLAQPGAESSVLRHSLAVIPAGNMPSERRIGLDTALSWYGGDADEVRRATTLLRLAGVGSVRDRFSWSQVQKQAGQANWGRYLTVAKELDKSGFDVVQVFHDSPSWARYGGAEKLAADRTPPNGESAYVLGQAFAKGLGPHVRFVEYWNEQNSGFFRGYPFEYAEGLKAFYAGVKSADPDITVLLGAAAGTPGPFFDDLYRNNVVAAMDIRNQHYYGKAEGIAAFAVTQNTLQKSAGLGAKPAWLTEVGYSLKRDAAGDWQKSEREQASYLLKAYAEGFAAGYERVFFFLLKELIEDDFHTWGLLHSDLSPRPAYLALAMLSRHIQNAEPAATLRAKGVTAVYFRKRDGSYQAIAWGEKRTLSVAGAFNAATDGFGRQLNRAAVFGKDPVLLSGIRTLPRQAKALQLKSQISDKTSSAAKFRLGALVSIDQVELPRPSANTVPVSVADGQTVSVSGRVVRDGAAKAAVNIECSAGPNLSAVGATRFHAETVPADGFFYRCTYTVDTAGMKQSFISVRAVQGVDQDMAYVALAPDSRRALARLVVNRPLLPVKVCGSWSHNASANVKLDIQKKSTKGDCGAMVFRSEVTGSGETWVFPGSAIGLASFARSAGVQFEVAEVPGSPFPPRPFLLQLVEKNGGIWLVELNKEQLDGARYRLSGLFESAKPAAWAKDKDGSLDLKKVQHFMLGWGGYGGQAGQRQGWSLETMTLIPNSSSEKRL